MHQDATHVTKCSLNSITVNLLCYLFTLFVINEKVSKTKNNQIRSKTESDYIMKDTNEFGEKYKQITPLQKETLQNTFQLFFEMFAKKNVHFSHKNKRCQSNSMIYLSFHKLFLANSRSLQCPFDILMVIMESIFTYWGNDLSNSSHGYKDVYSKYAL